VNPAVSVVIKSYNHAPYVAQSIQSVLDQSFQDFEIVVTDDGSTDATPDTIRGFTDSRIRFERFENNRGIATAMNATVARARGELIAILNSDDFALPGRLETQVAFLREHPTVAAVFGAPRQVGEDGAAVGGFEKFPQPFPGISPSRAGWLRYFFFYGNCLCAPTAMIRRAAYLEIQMDDERFGNLGDFDRWIRLLEKHEIHVMPQELTAFRVRANAANMSAPRPDSMLRSAFEAFEVLKRYRRFSREFLLEIFAYDIVAHEIETSGASDMWLAELALVAGTPWHRLFALDTMFDAARDEHDFRRLRELAGRINVFGLSQGDPGVVVDHDFLQRE
jgi:glycosyltransferase involved in cell wall biosynthesis